MKYLFAIFLIGCTVRAEPLPSVDPIQDTGIQDTGYDGIAGMAGSDAAGTGGFAGTAGTGGDSGTGGDGGTGGSEPDAGVDSGPPCTFNGPRDDHCDGVDNDCDGTVDEGELIDTVNRELGCPEINGVDPVCVAGQCSNDPRLSTCHSGYMDCDLAPDNGCEESTRFCIATGTSCDYSPGARRDCDGCEYILPRLYTGRRVMEVMGQPDTFEYVDDPGCPQG